MNGNSYPDWLKPHLSKGVYANKTTNGYTIYRAHFVYDPIKKRSKKITDEILGTVTEKGGFSPKKAYKKSLPTVFQFGTIKIIHDLCAYAFAKPLKEFVFYKNEIFVGSIMLFLYGYLDFELYNQSVLCKLYPKIRFDLMNGKQIYSEISRGALKIKSIIGDKNIFQFINVVLVQSNNTITVVNLTSTLEKNATKLGGKLEYETK